MCDGGEAAPRASPRLAEVLTAMIAMLAQGIDQFKQSGERSSDETRCLSSPSIQRLIVQVKRSDKHVYLSSMLIARECLNVEDAHYPIEKSP
jgi:hypothetical protein